MTKRQRVVLDEVADRHRTRDTTGHEFAARTIEACAADQDPIANVLEADRLWQAAQRRRADQEEAAWAEAKARERAESEQAPAWLAGASR